MKKLLLTIVILIGLIYLIFIPKIISVGPGIEPGTKDYVTIFELISIKFKLNPCFRTPAPNYCTGV